MIRSFRDRETERLAQGLPSRRFPDQLRRRAQRKLELLSAVLELDDLRLPPGNRLEMLTDDRIGQHSIRINDQWRICFRWHDGGFEDVEIVEYHR